MHKTVALNAMEKSILHKRNAKKKIEKFENLKLKEINENWIKNNNEREKKIINAQQTFQRIWWLFKWPTPFSPRAQFTLIYAVCAVRGGETSECRLYSLGAIHATHTTFVRLVAVGWLTGWLPVEILSTRTKQKEMVNGSVFICCVWLCDGNDLPSLPTTTRACVCVCVVVQHKHTHERTWPIVSAMPSPLVCASRACKYAWVAEHSDRYSKMLFSMRGFRILLYTADTKCFELLESNTIQFTKRRVEMRKKERKKKW